VAFFEMRRVRVRLRLRLGVGVGVGVRVRSERREVDLPGIETGRGPYLIPSKIN
jgi:hypothetical protein